MLKTPNFSTLICFDRFGLRENYENIRLNIVFFPLCLCKRLARQSSFLSYPRVSASRKLWKYKAKYRLSFSFCLWKGDNHRVGRVLSFFSSRRNWVSVPAPFGSGGRGTLAGESGDGRVTIPTGGHTLWYSLYIPVCTFCGDNPILTVIHLSFCLLHEKHSRILKNVPKAASPL